MNPGDLSRGGNFDVSVQGPNGELVEKTFVYVIASPSLEVVEDFESTPHKVLICLVDRDKEIRDCCASKMPKALSGNRVENSQEEARLKERKEGKKRNDGWRTRR